MATPLPEVGLSLTLREVAEATGGALYGDPSLTLAGLSTDSRAIVAGALFVALRGERFDGHDHLASARARGAGAALVERGRGGDGPRVEVDDTLRALASLASARLDRARTSGPLAVAAVSGAVGKTSTKELLAAAFDAVWPRAHATRGNLNNLVGAPLTVLSMPDAARSLVVECGSNARGEIARIAAMVRPDVAVVTNADAAHTEGLGSIEAVAEEEGSLFAYATRAVVGNADEPLSRAQMVRAQEGVARWLFGLAPAADARVVSRAVTEGGRARVTVALSDVLCPGCGELSVETGLLGPAAAVNLAAALCAVAAMGASVDAVRAAARALGTVRAAPGRLVPREVGGVLVIDDTYNASPRAVRAALAAAREVADARGARLVVALGDMLELGALSAEMHAAAVRDVEASGAALLVAVGPEMTAAAARASLRVVAAVDSRRGAEALSAEVRPGDVVLVKGSRGVRMERCVEAVVGGSSS